jgi:hypothetical protein
VEVKRAGVEGCLFLIIFTVLIPSYGLNAWAAAGVAVETLSPPKAVRPGEVVTHVFSVKNTGTSVDRYNLEVEAPPGWTIINVPPATGDLNPGEEERVFVTVIAPSTALAGSYSLVLKAASQTDPTVTDSATAIIEVLQMAAVELLAPPGKRADPGTTVSYTFTIINGGNVIDSFAVTARSSRGYPVELQPELIELFPGEQGKVFVTLYIPVGAEPGMDRLTVEAVSSVSPEVKASAMVITEILPPPPQAVGGTLFLEVPAYLRASLLGDLAERRISLPLDFSTRGEYKGLMFSLRANVADLLAMEEKRVALGLGTRGRESLLLEWSKEFSRVSISFPPLALSLRSQSEGTVCEASLALRAGLAGLGAKFGWSEWEGVRDQALSSSLRLDLDPLHFWLSSYRFGPNFPANPDKMGLSLSLSALLGPASLSFFSGFSRNNVEEDPTLPTISTLSNRANFLLALPGLPSLDLHFEDERRSGDALTPTREHRTQLSFRLAYFDYPFSISLYGSLGRQADYFAGTEYELSSFGSYLGFMTEEFTGVLALLLEGKKDAKAGSIIEATSKIDLALTLWGFILHSSLELAHPLRIYTEVSKHITKDIKIVFRQEIKEGEVTEGVELAAGFYLPIPFILVKGRIEGHVFIDGNGNGLLDPGEPGVPELILSLDRLLARTDEEGFYRFPPVYPGSYELNLAELPPGLVPGIPLPLKISLEAGQVLVVDIPLQRVGLIYGIVFHDLNRSGTLDRGEGGLAGVRLLLTGPVSQEGRSGPDGRFAFTVPVGEYLVRVDEATLPERFELTTPGEVAVRIKEAGEQIYIEFGAAERPRPIRFAPIASFTFSPEKPHPGEVVTFDGSASYDPDGFIVRWEWDFTGDGLTDAEGVVATWAFAQPGSYPVKLTVTDNDGFKGFVVKEVPVQ